MNIMENIFTALSGIMGNKMRALLTMFGIVVGISSVLMITSVGEGYKVSINKEFESIGLDKVTISTSWEEGIVLETDDFLTYDDVINLRKYKDLIEVSGQEQFGIYNALTMLNGEFKSAYLYGVDDAYYRMNTTKVKYGRTIIQADMDSASSVAIISENLALDLFGRTDVIGETFPFDTWGSVLDLAVIGVTESDSSSSFSSMYGGLQEVYVPITLAQGIFGGDTVGSISAKVNDKNNLTIISENINRILELNHENEGKYSITNVAQDMEQTDSVIGIFTLFLGIVAGISLLVGSIGVMNIMLVSVTERTREIGIRKSLGATNFTILMQFLIEAVILTGMGGIVGIVLGYLGGIGFASVATMLTGMALTPYIAPSVVLFVVAVSALIGIISGVYPAMRAAKLDPIEALRFE